MKIELVFETHSTTVENEQGIAMGWIPGKLSTLGREQAAALGKRRRNDGIDVVFTSDLARAVDTAEIAFAGADIPILHDWRLRECNYGTRNGMPAAEMHKTRPEFVDTSYPGGESWRQAIARVGLFLDDLPVLWDGCRALLIGHIATRWALQHFLGGRSIEDLLADDFTWQEGWEYRLER